MNEKIPLPKHDINADAQKFRSLHIPGNPLLLANIWDSATARLAERIGMRAIATTSAAIAPVNGYEDHGKMPPDVALNALRDIANAVSLPVTADLEDGYGLSAEALVERVLEVGACGVNIEDTDHSTGALVEANLQAERIAAIKAHARALGVDLVINARIDTHVHKCSTEEGTSRAQQYLLAGADCVYPIFLSDVSVIKDYVSVGLTNILWRPGGPTFSELASAGVSRISVGPLLYQFVMKKLWRAIDALHRLDDKGVWI